MRITGVSTMGPVRVVSTMGTNKAGHTICCAWCNPGYSRENMTHTICRICKGRVYNQFFGKSVPSPIPQATGRRGSDLQGSAFPSAFTEEVKRVEVAG